MSVKYHECYSLNVLSTSARTLQSRQFFLEFLDFFFEGFYLVLHGIWKVAVIELIPHADPFVLDDLSGHSNDGRIVRYVLQYNGPCTDTHVVTYRYITQYDSARTYDHVVADGRVPLTFTCGYTAKRHTLIDHHMIAYYCGLAYHDACRVIYEETIADGRTRMDVRTAFAMTFIIDPQGLFLLSLQPQLMGFPVHRNYMQTHVKFDRFLLIRYRWIAFHNCCKIVIAYLHVNQLSQICPYLNICHPRPAGSLRSSSLLPSKRSPMPRTRLHQRI